MSCRVTQALLTLGLLLAPSFAHPRLVASVEEGDLAAVSAALDAGVDVNEASREPFSVGRGSSDQRSITGVTPLMGATIHTDPSRRDRLVAKLVGAGAAVDTEADDGTTALRFCTQKNQASTAALLLQAGADVDGTERSGNPLTIAAQFGHEEVVAVLIEAGAWVDAYSPEPIDATPLLMAAAKGHVEVVRQLLDAGARIDLENARGVVPHMGAALEALRGQGSRSIEVVQMLLSAGAPASDLEDMVLGRPPSGIEAVELVLQLVRAHRAEEQAAAARPLLVWLRGRGKWMLLVLAGALLWSRRKPKRPLRKSE